MHFVTGHRNPDTDAIVAAHVYAWLHNYGKDEPEIIPVRLDEANPQTQWLFQEACEALPILRTDCRSTVGELAGPAFTVRPSDPLGRAVDLLDREQTELIAVVDDRHNVVGVIGEGSQRVNYLLRCDVEEMLGTILPFDAVISGLRLAPMNDVVATREPSRVVVATPTPDYLERCLQKGNLVVAGPCPDLLARATPENCGAIVVCRHSSINVEKEAAACAVPVYYYPDSPLTFASRLAECFPCEAAMETNSPTVSRHEIAGDCAKKLAKSDNGLLVLDSEGTLTGVFLYQHLLGAERPKLVLVDHLERAQSISGIEEAEITAVVDHHRIGDIETALPLDIDCRAWGSTSSILASRAAEAGIPLTRGIAILLLGGIISDTLLLSSPTTTDHDRRIAHRLADEAGLVLEEFGLHVLQKNDRLTTEDAGRLVRADCKSFHAEGIRFVVSQIETTDLNRLDSSRTEELSSAFSHLIPNNQAAFGVLMVTDVLARHSRVFVHDESGRHAGALLPPDANEFSWDAPGWVSRKKQMVPYIVERLARLDA